ncbi:hypothetical protein ACLOJK_022526 [Asimina triloba]
MLQVSNIMDEDERWKIIVARKCPKEVGVEQVSQEVLKPNANVPSEWELLGEVFAKVYGMAREGLKVKRERCQVKGITEGEWRFFFKLLEMGRHANRAEALREEAEKAILELHSILDATRVELDEARDDTEGISLAKQDLEWALAKHAQEEASRLSSELDVVRAGRDEVVGRVVTAKEEVLQSLTELVTFRYEIKVLHARGADPNIDKESSSTGFEATRGEVSALQERVTILSLRESELFAESETVRAEVTPLRMELEASRVECLQVPSPQGG